MSRFAPAMLAIAVIAMPGMGKGSPASVASLPDTVADRDAQVDLNDSYRALMSYLGPSGRARLRVEERRWIATRIRRCGAGLEGPCVLAATKARTRALENRLDRLSALTFPRVGSCTTSPITVIGPRLEGAPDSGTTIVYRSGLHQVSYDVIEGAMLSRIGDQVRSCVVSLPKHCPRNDHRGIVYSSYNQRTGQRWQAPDSQHQCNGA